MSQMSLLAPAPEPPITGEFPRLEGAREIAIDVETFDPNLKKRGPGDVRRDGRLVGIAVAADHRRWYLPMRHEGGGNMDADAVLRWARDELSRPGQTKIGANIMYDVGWLAAEGVEVAGPFADVQFAAALLDETADSYELEAIGRRYLGEGKSNMELLDHLSRAYGGNPIQKEQGGRIHLAPASKVAPYAIGDVDLPLRLMPVLRDKMAEEGLEEVFDLECRLIPMLLAMRRRGVRVSIDRIDKIRDDMRTRYDLAIEELRAFAGRKIDPWSADSIAPAFDAENLNYPITPKTRKPSFTKTWLENHPHRVARLVLDARKWSKAISTFVDGMVVDNLVGDRVHPQVHPLRRVDDQGKRGTVSGRFSYSQPNLQFVPERDEEMRSLVRSLFVPEDGEEWVKHDLSQIEYRYLVHFAVKMHLSGADEAAERYQKDPKTDYHDMVRSLIREATGKELERRPTKIINFGLIYGMGKGKLAWSLGFLRKRWTISSPCTTNRSPTRERS